MSRSPTPLRQLDAPMRLSGSVSLVDWQEDAVRKWLTGDTLGPHRGTLEIFTGGGKPLSRSRRSPE